MSGPKPVLTPGLEDARCQSSLLSFTALSAACALCCPHGPVFPSVTGSPRLDTCSSFPLPTMSALSPGIKSHRSCTETRRPRTLASSTALPHVRARKHVGAGTSDVAWRFRADGRMSTVAVLKGRTRPSCMLCDRWKGSRDALSWVPQTQESGKQARSQGPALGTAAVSPVTGTPHDPTPMSAPRTSLW